MKFFFAKSALIKILVEEKFNISIVREVDLIGDDEPAQTRHVVDISDLYNVVLSVQSAGPMTNSRHFRWSALGSQPTIDNWAGILQTCKNFNFDVQHWGHNADPAWEKLWQRQGEALLERPPFPPKLFHYCRLKIFEIFHPNRKNLLKFNVFNKFFSFFINNCNNFSSLEFGKFVLGTVCL